MDNLYKENSIKINNEIAKEQNNYVKYGKWADRCKAAFKMFSIGHIIISGIYALGLIVPAMLSMSTLPFVTPVMCGIIGSCAVTVSLSAILEGIFKKKQEKSSKRFDNLRDMKREYETKPVSRKENIGNIRCKNIIPSFNCGRDETYSLSLKNRSS